MAKKSEIKKYIKFYKKEMEKWEFRILISLILIFFGNYCFLPFIFKSQQLGFHKYRI